MIMMCVSQAKYVAAFFDFSTQQFIQNVAASDCTCSDVVVFLSAIQTQQSLNLPRGLAYFCTRFLPKE